jgi:predicted nucleic-acid-binding Zn-ribbon protein
MKQTGKCPKCASSEIIADAKVIDRSEGLMEQEMTVATFRNPEALFLEGKQETTVSAWVCARCGYTEFYADFPSKIELPKA